MNLSLAGGTSAHLSRRQVGIFALAATATATLGTSVANASTSDLRSVSNEQRAADTQTLLNLINQFRAENGLGPLRHSATLAAIQEPEARRQFAQGYVSHGTAFLNDSRAAGYSFAREVIALSYNDDLGQLLAFWKSSPAHRAAVLAPEANAAGIGLAYGYGNGLPWRVLGNVGIYRYESGRGPADLTSQVSAASAHEIKGAIGELFRAEGGTARFGEPITDEISDGIGGVHQRFSKDGTVTRFVWSQSTGAHYLRENSGIGSYWLANGAEKELGYPTMNESGGLVDGGAYQLFRKNDGTSNKVLWSPATGTHHVLETGGIGWQWSHNGFENGYGYPVSGEEWSGQDVIQRFSKGVTVVWDSTDGDLSVVR